MNKLYDVYLCKSLKDGTVWMSRRRSQVLQDIATEIARVIVVNAEYWAEVRDDSDNVVYRHSI